MKRFLLLLLILLSVFLVSCDLLESLGIELPGSEPELFTVEFESNGGSEVISQQVHKNSTIKRPENPTKEGYYFDGWYCDGEKWSFTSNTVDCDLLLEANWLPLLNISFSTSKGMCPAPQKAEPNGLIKEPTSPQADGYLFDGWYYNDEKWNFDRDTVKKEITLEARFVKVVTITFNVDDGIIDRSTQEIRIGSEIGELPTPVREGYIFRGWYLSGDSSYYNAILPTTTFEKDASLISRWEEDASAIVITFDVNGGKLKGDLPYKAASINKPIGTLPIPAPPENGEFVGWYDENGKRYSQNIESSQSTQLIAKYQFNDACPVTGKEYHDFTSWYYELYAPTCTEDYIGIKTCKDCKLEHIMVLEDAKGHTYDDNWTYSFMAQTRKCTECQAEQTLEYKDITDKIDDYNVKGNIYGEKNIDCLFNGNWDETDGTTFSCKDGTSVTVTIDLSIPTNVDGVYVKGTGGYTFIVHVQYEGTYSFTQISTGSFGNEPCLVKLNGNAITEIMIEMKGAGYGDGYWQEIALVQIPD